MAYLCSMMSGTSALRTQMAQNDGMAGAWNHFVAFALTDLAGTAERKDSAGNVE